MQEFFDVYDTNGNGVLEKNEAREAVKHIIETIKGPGSFKLISFEEWFDEFD